MLENFKKMEVKFIESPLIERQKFKEITNMDMKRIDEPLQKEMRTNDKCELNYLNKTWIKLDSGWSNEVVDNLSSMDEYKHYKNIGLKEVQVGDKPCLIRCDIDFEQKDIFGKTNLERMYNGKAPLDANGKPIELHHIGQHANSPLAQLTWNEHRGEGIDTLLHNKNKISEIDRNAFDKERANHWKDFQKSETIKQF